MMAGYRPDEGLNRGRRGVAHGACLAAGHPSVTVMADTNPLAPLVSSLGDCAEGVFGA